MRPSCRATVGHCVPECCVRGPARPASRRCPESLGRIKKVPREPGPQRFTSDHIGLGAGDGVAPLMGAGAGSRGRTPLRNKDRNLGIGAHLRHTAVGGAHQRCRRAGDHRRAGANEACAYPGVAPGWSGALAGAGLGLPGVCGAGWFPPRLGGGGMSAGGYGDPPAGGVGVSCDDRASEVDHPVVVGAQQDQI